MYFPEIKAPIKKHKGEKENQILGVFDSAPMETPSSHPYKEDSCLVSPELLPGFLAESLVNSPMS